MTEDQEEAQVLEAKALIERARGILDRGYNGRGVTDLQTLITIRPHILATLPEYVQRSRRTVEAAERILQAAMPKGSACE